MTRHSLLPVCVLAGSLLAAAEDIPFDKWKLPPSAQKEGALVRVSRGVEKNSPLLWGPFLRVGEKKVLMLKVKLSGKGEIQGSLGCYSAEKKRFITRCPFAAGTRKIDSREVREETWFLQLPKKSREPVGWIRAVLRIVSGEFTLHQVQTEEMKEMPRIIPIRDLKKTSELSQMCKDSAEPIFVTKNGYGDMVIMSMEMYEKKMYMLDVYEKLDAERYLTPIKV